MLLCIARKLSYASTYKIISAEDQNCGFGKKERVRGNPGPPAVSLIAVVKTRASVLIRDRHHPACRQDLLLLTIITNIVVTSI